MGLLTLLFLIYTFQIHTKDRVFLVVKTRCYIVLRFLIHTTIQMILSLSSLGNFSWHLGFNDCVMNLKSHQYKIGWKWRWRWSIVQQKQLWNHHNENSCNIIFYWFFRVSSIPLTPFTSIRVSELSFISCFHPLTADESGMEVWRTYWFGNSVVPRIVE